MIKINLIPSKRKKKAKPIPSFIVLGIFILIVAGIISFIAVYIMNSKIDSLQAQKKANDAKMAELKLKMEEVKKFEALNKKFTDRKNIIEQLSKNQSLPVRFVDEIAKTLTDGVWISSLNIVKDKVTLSGVGFSNSDIVAYIQSLKQSGLFNEVVLQGTTRVMTAGIETYSFSITFGVNS